MRQIEAESSFVTAVVVGAHAFGHDHLSYFWGLTQAGTKQKPIGYAAMNPGGLMPNLVNVTIANY
jgi:hypothetical protein